MQLPSLQKAVLIRRYKRFLADVELASGEVITVHCPNTGAMTGCAQPGCEVWLSTSASKTRKYAQTWELVETQYGMACIHSAKANKVVREALDAQRIEELRGYANITAEVKYGTGSRIDFLLEGRADAAPQSRAYVEVKSVTLCGEAGQGLFPDAVSDRGRKHIQELQSVARQAGVRGVLLFCVMHNGIDRVSAARHIDSAYSETLEEAMQAGVEVLACRAHVGVEAVEITESLPFLLDI